MNTFKILAVSAAIALTTGCSSIVSKSEYPVNISSAPVGATFTITGEKGNVVADGTTPETITLKASSGFFNGETYKIKLSKAGYADKTITLDSGIDGWYFGNIIFGGWIGLLLIDPATGAMFTLPDNSKTSLIEIKEKPKTLTIKSVNELTAEERKQLVKL